MGAVVITGSSTGIGRATALALDNLGYRVFAGVRRDADGDDLRSAASSRLVPVHVDITDEGSIAAAREIVTDRVGADGLAGLVNNAGTTVPCPIECLPLEVFRRQLEVNLVGHLAVTQAFLPLLKRARGRVVNVSSVGGRLGTPLMATYAAAKHGLEGMSDALRLELRAMASTISREASRGSHPDVVARAVVHALTSRRPKVRYPVGAGAKRMLFLRRVLPDRMVDHMVLKAVGLSGTR
jgi:NAD(P)-dependent dehydrogenase (short-subunit alcohol dehydrogenase family)